MKSKRVWRLSCLLLVVIIVYGGYSLVANSLEGAQKQSKTDKKQDKAAEMKQDKPDTQKSYIDLRQERDALEQEIRDIQNDLPKLADAKYWLEEEATLKKQLEATKKRKDPPPSKEELQKLEDQIAQKRANSGTNESLDTVVKQIDGKNADLNDKKNRKDKIEKKLSRLIDIERPKQDFKKELSYIFAGLIGLMILGFFVIAFRDKIVRREIFHGQAGIQFITLFSVVIAIILFGILDILEGKELAALLGGLSGYILGRVTTPSTAAEPKTPVSSPSITGISPDDVTVGPTPIPLDVQIIGDGLQLANSVKIVQGANEVPVSDITSNDLVINFKALVDANQAKGKYDVIVTNSDGAVAKLPQAFTVK